MASLTKARNVDGDPPQATSIEGGSLIDVLPARHAPLHIHFGAGRLGLGLLVPSIAASGVPYCVVQRPSAEFRCVIGADDEEGEASEESLAASSTKRTVTLVVNGEESKHCEMQVVTSVVELPQSWARWLWLHSLPTSTSSMLNSVEPPTPRGLFICSTDQLLLDSLVGTSTSFSTSLGVGLCKMPHFMRTAGTRATTAEERPILFAGENDHDAVENLRTLLSDRVDVVSCMVDRICTDRSLKRTGRNCTTVDVVCEPYKGFLMPRVAISRLAFSPPFAGDAIWIPRSNEEASYLSTRKLILVNGLHTTLAFLTLCHQVDVLDPLVQIPLPTEKDKLAVPLDTCVLMTSESAPDEETKNKIWCWAVARCLCLLHEPGLEVIKKAHSTDIQASGPKADPNCVAIDKLLAYARTTLSRFVGTEDTTGRILGGGVANRYKGRMEPIMVAVNRGDAFEVLGAKLLLEQAGVRAVDVVDAVNELTSDALQFTGLGCRKPRSRLERVASIDKLDVYQQRAAAADDLTDHSEKL